MPKHLRSQDPTVTVKSKTIITYATANSLEVITLSPLNLDAWLINESDGYQEYRFTSLHVSAVIHGTANGFAPCILGYSPSLPSATPSASQLMQYPIASMGMGQAGAPWPSLTIGRDELLANGPKWFRRGTAYDDLTEFQGTIGLANYNGTAFSTYPCFVVISYTVELRGHIPTALTAERLKAVLAWRARTMNSSVGGVDPYTCTPPSSIEIKKKPIEEKGVTSDPLQHVGTQSSSLSSAIAGAVLSSDSRSQAPTLGAGPANSQPSEGDVVLSDYYLVPRQKNAPPGEGLVCRKPASTAALSQR